MDLRFRRTYCCAFGQSIRKDSTNFASWLLVMSLAYLNKPEDWGWWVQWKCYKTSQTLQFCQSTWPVKWAPWSLWHSRRDPQVGVIFSKKALATEEMVACLKGKAEVQCENLWTVPKTYLRPLVGGSCIKSICLTSNCPMGILKCLKGVWTGFPGLYFRQMGQMK